MSNTTTGTIKEQEIPAHHAANAKHAESYAELQKQEAAKAKGAVHSDATQVKKEVKK